MKKVRDNIYQLTIPLPKSPLVATTDHLIIGGPGQRNLLIDTAFDNPVSRESLMSQLAELAIDLNETDLFITHMHHDHAGLILDLKRPGNKVFMSQVDGKLLRRSTSPRFVEWQKDTNQWLGIPDDLALALDVRVYKELDLTDIEVGEVLSYGGYDLTVVDLAGHTPGQIGLWEKNQGFLFAGDHVLNRVTPNISTWDLETDYLQIYMDNLVKTSQWEVAILYTGHFQAVTEPKERALAIVAHHQERLDVIAQLVTEHPQTAFEIASQMTWVGGQQLSALGRQQTWFASTEVMAHLQYLYFHDQIKRTVDGKRVYYYR